MITTIAIIIDLNLSPLYNYYYKEGSRDARFVCRFKLRYGCKTHNFGRGSGLKRIFRRLTQTRVNFFRNFLFTFLIVCGLLWCLVQREVLCPLHIYAAALTLGTHIQLSLLIRQAIALKLGIHNPDHKKVPFVCWCPHFPYILIFFFFFFFFLIILVNVLRKSAYYVKCNKESRPLQSLADVF